MDHLRLILIVLGVVLIAGIYVWELLRRRSEARARERALAGATMPGDPLADADDDSLEILDRVQDRRAARNARELEDIDEYDIDENFPAEEAADTQPEPVAGGDPAPPGSQHDGSAMIEVRARASRGVPGSADAARLEAHDGDQEIGEGLGRLRGFAVRRDAPEQLDLSGLELRASLLDPHLRAGSSPRGRKSAGAASEPDTDAEDPLLIVITVMAKDGRDFAGAALREALEASGMRHGDMQIFHRPAAKASASDAPLFSAANVVNPGYFEIDTMDDVSTPGIVLFLRLPGPQRPAEAFQEMLDTAARLAERLQGRVCDETRSTLTSQSINHLRERIADFSRRRLLKA